MEHIVDRIYKKEGTLGMLIADDNLHSDMEKLFFDMQKLVSENRENITKTIANLQNTSDKMEHIVDRIYKKEGTLGMLIADDNLHSDIEKLLLDMGKLVSDIKERPWRLLLRNDRHARTRDRDLMEGNRGYIYRRRQVDSR
jgi:hypothetical protein